MELLNYIQANWVEWLFAGGFALLGYGFRQLRKQQQEESIRNAALREGVEACGTGSLTATIITRIRATARSTPKRA